MNGHFFISQAQLLALMFCMFWLDHVNIKYVSALYLHHYSAVREFLTKEDGDIYRKKGKDLIFAKWYKILGIISWDSRRQLGYYIPPPAPLREKIKILTKSEHSVKTTFCLKGTVSQDFRPSFFSSKNIFQACKWYSRMTVPFSKIHKVLCFKSTPRCSLHRGVCQNESSQKFWIHKNLFPVTSV